MSEATFLLGQRYDLAAAVENARWRLDTGSIMWLTYRRDFAPMRPYKYDSDAGWGCMLRASQMLMAQALQRHALGRDWRARARGGPFSCGAAAAASRAAELRADARWVRLARWFADQPGERAVYSIHNIVQLGLLYDKLPGEWYGPSSAARVLRDLARMHRHVGARAERAARETAADAEAPTPADDDDDEFAGALEVYLPASEIIYASEVHRLCAGPATPSPPSAEGDDDPLHRPPPPPSESAWLRADTPWKSAVLVLVPLRLGLGERLHAPYAAGLLRTLRLRHSVGFIGGRPSHALYFVGARGRVLHGLDPHTTQLAYTLPERTAPAAGAEPVPPADGTFLCDAHVSSMNCWGSGGGSGPNEMCVDSLDPSLALGFYCADRADFEAFSESVAQLAADSKSRGEPPLFSVDLVTEPTPEEATAQGSAQELLLVDDDRDDADGGGAEDEDEDDFVLV